MAANNLENPSPPGAAKITTDTSADDHADGPGNDKLANIPSNEGTGTSTSADAERLQSKEWDASKVPPSQFQRPSGSIFATPHTRDGHVQDSSRDKAYWDKLKEKGWTSKK